MYQNSSELTPPGWASPRRPVSIGTHNAALAVSAQMTVAEHIHHPAAQQRPATISKL